MVGNFWISDQLWINSFSLTAAKRGLSILKKSCTLYLKTVTALVKITCWYVWNSMQMEQYGGLEPIRSLYSLSFLRLGGLLCQRCARGLAQFSPSKLSSSARGSSSGASVPQKETQSLDSDNCRGSRLKTVFLLTDSFPTCAILQERDVFWQLNHITHWLFISGWNFSHLLEKTKKTSACVWISVMFGKMNSLSSENLNQLLNILNELLDTLAITTCQGQQRGRDQAFLQVEMTWWRSNKLELSPGRPTRG